jgi:hypothetical protein
MALAIMCWAPWIGSFAEWYEISDESAAYL